MDTVTLSELADVIGATRSVTDEHASFESNSIDTRTMRRGEVFWALSGAARDGHEFVPDAQRGGARAVVVSRPCGNPRNRLVVPDVPEALTRFASWYRGMLQGTVVGITGSVGKTTCRRLIHDVLTAKYQVSESPANYNNHIGVPLSLLQARGADDFVVLELGASAVGEIRELSGLAAPEIGVITAIAPAHLDGFASVANIQRGKGELVRSLPEFGTALLNGDDPLVRELASEIACEVRFFGRAEDCDVRATDVAATTESLSFRVADFRYSVPITGEHHLPNVLAAIALGREAGLLPVEIQEGLRAFRGAAGRCDVRRFDDSVLIDDAYNASPASVAAAANVLSKFDESSRRVLVLGEMAELGDAAEELHEQTGRICASARDIDLILAVGVFAPAIVSGARAAGHANAYCFARVDDLLQDLADRIRPGDAVLVKGSRVARMERVVDRLAQCFGQSPENTSAA